MRKLLLIAWQEVAFTLRQWTFHLTFLGLPLLFAALGAAPRLSRALQRSPLQEIETVFNPPQTITIPTGYVDQLGLIAEVPAEQAQHLQPFEDETAARRSLAAGEITSFYVIPREYLDQGIVYHYSTDPQLFADTDGGLTSLLRRNVLLAAAGPERAARLEQPLALTVNGPPALPLRFVPAGLDISTLIRGAAVIGLFGFLLGFTGSLLLRALERETQARVLEMLVTSASPAQVLLGKLAGLCALAVVQAILTLLAGLLAYRSNGAGSGLANVRLAEIAATLPYLVLGYVAYCAAVAGLVGLLPRIQESFQVLALLRMLAFTPLLGLLFILPAPDGAISRGLTLFPISSPLLMPARVLLGPVPLWQHALSVALLALWAAASLWLAARLFRAQGLLTGNTPSRRLLWQAVRG